MLQGCDLLLVGKGTAATFADVLHFKEQCGEFFCCPSTAGQDLAPVVEGQSEGRDPQASGNGEDAKYDKEATFIRITSLSWSGHVNEFCAELLC